MTQQPGPRNPLVPFGTPGSSPAPQPGVPSQPGWGPAPKPAPQPTSVSIDDFKPRSRLGQLLGLIAALAALALIAWGVFMATRPDDAPRAAATPSSTRPAATPNPTRTPSATSKEWVDERSNSAGWWSVVDQTRSGDTLHVKIILECDRGEVPLRFFAFSNGTMSNNYRAETGPVAREPNLEGVRLKAGQRLEGWVTLTMPPTEATLIMGTSTSNAISGMLLKP